MRRLSASIGDIDRRLAHVVKVGRVIAADYPNARIKVAVGRNQTGWVPWLTSRAGNDKTWHAPEIGEQVVVVSPSGDMAQGFVLPGAIFSGANPANGTEATKKTETFADGAVIQYDRTAHAYSITLPSASKATIAAGSNAKVLVENNDVTLSFGSNASIAVNASGITLTVGFVSLSLTSSGISVNGNINQTGNLVASGDVSAGTVTLKTHTHPGVTIGSGSTGVGVG